MSIVEYTILNYVLRLSREWSEAVEEVAPVERCHFEAGSVTVCRSLGV